MHFCADLIRDDGESLPRRKDNIGEAAGSRGGLRALLKPPRVWGKHAPRFAWPFGLKSRGTVQSQKRLHIVGDFRSDRNREKFLLAATVIPSPPPQRVKHRIFRPNPRRLRKLDFGKQVRGFDEVGQDARQTEGPLGTPCLLRRLDSVQPSNGADARAPFARRGRKPNRNRGATCGRKKEAELF